MESKSRKLRSIVVLLVVLLIGFGAWYYTHGELFNHSPEDITIISVKSGGISKEIKVVYPEGFTYLYENGVQVKLITVIPRKVTGALTLIDLAEVVGKNTIEDKTPVSEMLWGSTLQESSEYLKYLTDAGYTLKQVASTPQYIECFLQKESTVQRVVVFQNSIMLGELNTEASIPSIDSYFKGYIN